TDDGALLGLPIGGHGRETSLAIRYDDAPRRVTASVHVALRDRGEENLFAPDRAGSALAVDARFTFFPTSGLRFDGWAGGEHADDWEYGTFRLALVHAF